MKNYEEMYCDKYGVCKGMDCPNYNRCKGLDTTKKEDNKKTLLNSKIRKEELNYYSKIIVKKALKVISCSGSIYAIRLLENRDVDTLEDLYQEVATQLILDDYVVTKNAYKVVRSYIYHNYEKNEVELFASDEMQEEKENDVAYISYLNNNNDEKKELKKLDTKKLYSILSDRQKEVYKYYFINNMRQVDIAKMFECGKKNINNLINDIKIKAKKCIIEV